MSIVAIVGRPNVGKSTLFNRLIKKRDAIVDDLSGVTRDRHYGKSEWNGKEFSVIDTGGYIEASEDIIQSEISRQVKFAIEEADVIIIMVDGKVGLLPLDEDIFNLTRKISKPVFVVVNKIDNFGLIQYASEFYQLGIDKFFPISSINGSGTGDLLDEVVVKFEEKAIVENDIPRVAIVGRPNAGKSSYINCLLEKDRYIVTDIAGTTRDSIDTYFNKFGFELNLIDTAGIRRKSKVKDNVEFYSVMRSIRTIERSDVCVLILDSERGFESQDKAIFWLAANNNKGILILANKWDLIEDKTHNIKTFKEKIYREIKPFDDVPILFVSVKNKQRVIKSLEAIVDVYKNRNRRINTKKLNEVMLPIIKNTPPPMLKDKMLNIKFCTQLPTHYPQFIFYCNLEQYIKDSYKRFLENSIRKNFNFHGVPMSVFFRKK